MNHQLRPSWMAILIAATALIACKNDKKDVISSRSTPSISSSIALAQSPYVGIWRDIRQESNYFHIPNDSTRCSSLNRNCNSMQIKDRIISVDLYGDGQHKPFAWIIRQNGDTLVLKESEASKVYTTYVRLGPSDSARAFPDRNLDSTALILELQKLQKAILTRDLATLKSFFAFPIRGEIATTLWIASTPDQSGNVAPTTSDSFEEADFEAQVDSLLRRGNDLRALKTLRIEHFGDSIASGLVQTGPRDSSSVSIRYEFEENTLRLNYGGKYFVNPEEGWYDNSSWFFIFEIKDGKHLIFKEIQGAG